MFHATLRTARAVVALAVLAISADASHAQAGFDRRGVTYSVKDAVQDLNIFSTRYINAVQSYSNGEFTLSRDDIEALSREVDVFIAAFNSLPDDSPVSADVKSPQARILLQQAVACSLCGAEPSPERYVNLPNVPNPKTGRELKALIDARLKAIERILKSQEPSISKDNLLGVEQEFHYLRVITLAYM